MCQPYDTERVHSDNIQVVKYQATRVHVMLLKNNNEKTDVRPNVEIMSCPTKIGNWSDMCPVKKKYLFAALCLGDI